jgi:hypothetical protein
MPILGEIGKAESQTFLIGKYCMYELLLFLTVTFPLFYIAMY